MFIDDRNEKTNKKILGYDRPEKRYGADTANFLNRQKTL